MKKRILAVILAMTMVSGMLACGNSQEVKTQKTESVETESVETESVETESAETESAETESAETEIQTGEPEKQTEKAEVEADDAKIHEKEENAESKEEDTMAGTVYKIEIAAKEIPKEDAFTFVQNMKVGWNLGNTLDAHENGKVGENELKTEEVWGNPVTTKAMIDEIKAAGDS